MDSIRLCDVLVGVAIWWVDTLASKSAVVCSGGPRDTHDWSNEAIEDGKLRRRRASHNEHLRSLSLSLTGISAVMRVVFCEGSKMDYCH